MGWHKSLSILKADNLFDEFMSTLFLSGHSRMFVRPSYFALVCNFKLFIFSPFFANSHLQGNFQWDK